MENWPFSILGIQGLKKSWALKDSYVTWKIKKKKKIQGTSRGKILRTQSAHPKVIRDEMPKKNILSTFKLTYFHLVQRNAIITSNTK